MDSITMLRRLWSHRRVLVVVCLLAVLAGTEVMYKISFPPKLESRGYEVGVATDQILVDTPQSQVVEVSPRGTATISEQALLLASLMVDGAIKSDIAHNAGLQPNQIIGVNNAVTQPSASGPAPVTPPSGPRAYVLTTQVLTDSAGNGLPIIELTAQAPNSVSAAKLATAAITSVRAYLASVASEHGIPDSHRLQVSELGVSQTTQVRGPSIVIAILAVMFVLGFGCACILAAPALVRGWRAAAAREKLGHDGLLLALQDGPTPDGPFPTEVPGVPTVADVQVPARPTSERPLEWAREPKLEDSFRDALRASRTSTSQKSNQVTLRREQTA